MRAYMCARAHPCWRSLLCASLALAHSMCRSFRVAPIVWSDVGGVGASPIKCMHLLRQRTHGAEPLSRTRLCWTFLTSGRSQNANCSCLPVSVRGLRHGQRRWPSGCCADGGHGEFGMVHGSRVWYGPHLRAARRTPKNPHDDRSFFDSEGPTTHTRSPLTARHPPGARECTGRGCSCERSEMVARARSSRHAADSSWTPCAVPSYLVSGGPIIFARSNSVMPLWGFPATRSHLAAAPCWDRAGLPMASLA